SSLAAAPAGAETRYTPPPATVLSGDLASPWLLQLKNREQYQKRMQRNQQALLRWQAQEQKRQTARVAFRPKPAQPSPQPQTARSKQANDPNRLDPQFLPQRVEYASGERPGTIIIDTERRYLYLVEANGVATRYGVGVGRAGFEWSGTEKISRKSEWPEWRPPEEMRERERARGRELPVVMAGGPENPLGARAMYLGGTLYRIHGTNQPWTIGKAMSSGCIRMRNEDVTELYERVGVGTKVVVL
ncbi:MAG: L,D-transpeptidase, partial [Nitratireductor sp.]|nr:L,D-transpeptidase [Nitratireductor sp.]